MLKATFENMGCKIWAVITKPATCFCFISFIYNNQFIIWIVFKERDSLNVYQRSWSQRDLWKAREDHRTKVNDSVGGEWGTKQRIACLHYPFSIKKDQPAKENSKHSLPRIINLRFKNVSIMCKVKWWSFISNHEIILYQT